MKSEESKKIKNLVEKLEKADYFSFPQNGYIINAPDDQGVYIISDSHKLILHVGRTVRGARGLYQRLRNHLRGQSSFVRKELDGNGESLRNGCKYRFLIIPDSRTRALVEALAIGMLCPKHLGIGESKSTNSKPLK